MTALALLNHVLNFLAPALWLALLLPLVSRWIFRKRVKRPGLGVQVLVNFVFCLLALGLGLWFFGRDGKMATYLAMTVTGATSQWLMLRGWRA
jgi:hypothetical protein